MQFQFASSYLIIGLDSSQAQAKLTESHPAVMILHANATGLAALGEGTL